MRLIMLDTETTGLSAFNGDRIVEIGAVEVVNRHLDPEKTFHHYINPGRPIPAEVVRIHGISDAHVKDKPPFAEVAAEFLAFIAGATLVIHNAPFDLGFIMNELHLAGLPAIADVPVIDTLDLARKRHPQQRNNLDALCDRYRIERGHRTLHGALLDSQLLAEVYLAMTGGRQFSLAGDVPARAAGSFVRMPEQASQRDEKVETATLMRRAPPPIQEQEMAAHTALMARIHKESDGKALWHPRGAD
jgi:DNA polymerase-3 subunit epsilon